MNFRPQGIIRQAKIKVNEIEHLAAVGPILHIAKFINKRDIATQVPHYIGEIHIGNLFDNLQDGIRANTINII